MRGLESIDDAEEWIERNQLGKRNLPPDRIAYFRGCDYERIKRKQGAPVGNTNAQKQKGHSDPIESEEDEAETSQASNTAADIVSKTFGVSPTTAKNDAAFKRAIDSLVKLFGSKMADQ